MSLGRTLPKTWTPNMRRLLLVPVAIFHAGGNVSPDEPFRKFRSKQQQQQQTHVQVYE